MGGDTVRQPSQTAFSSAGSRDSRMISSASLRVIVAPLWLNFPVE